MYICKKTGTAQFLNLPLGVSVIKSLNLKLKLELCLRHRDEKVKTVVSTVSVNWSPAAVEALKPPCRSDRRLR